MNFNSKNLTSFFSSVKSQAKGPCGYGKGGPSISTVKYARVLSVTKTYFPELYPTWKKGIPPLLAFISIMVGKRKLRNIHEGHRPVAQGH